MEMPEGLTKLIAIKNHLLSSNYPGAQDDGWCADEAIDLLKEMTEALEEASYRMKPCTDDERDLVAEALKKFREWK